MSSFYRRKAVKGLLHNCNPVIAVQKSMKDTPEAKEAFKHLVDYVLFLQQLYTETDNHLKEVFEAVTGNSYTMNPKINYKGLSDKEQSKFHKKWTLINKIEGRKKKGT